jgi:hypothetical protein
MVEVLISQPVMKEALVQYQAIPSVVYDGQSGTGAGFSSSMWVV